MSNTHTHTHRAYRFLFTGACLNAQNLLSDSVHFWDCLWGETMTLSIFLWQMFIFMLMFWIMMLFSSGYESISQSLYVLSIQYSCLIWHACGGGSHLPFSSLIYRNVFCKYSDAWYCPLYSVNLSNTRFCNKESIEVQLFSTLWIIFFGRGFMDLWRYMKIPLDCVELSLEEFISQILQTVPMVPALPSPLVLNPPVPCLMFLVFKFGDPKSCGPCAL